MNPLNNPENDELWKNGYRKGLLRAIELAKKRMPPAGLSAGDIPSEMIAQFGEATRLYEVLAAELEAKND